MSGVILPPDSELYAVCMTAVQTRKMIFLAGLPGAGKSLLLQQLALLAEKHDRAVHLLQWDVSRIPFETPAILQKYPEIDGVTHAAIRKGVGLWARAGVEQWQEEHPGSDQLLLGELPLIGNRLIELAQPLADGAERYLRSEEALFIVPVPSREVRAHIEAARERSIANPQHEKERQDAQPNVLRMLWRDVARVGHRLGLTPEPPGAKPAYDPAVYTAVFRHLLQHRQTQMLPVTEILKPPGSAYDLAVSGGELAAAPAEVTALLNQVEQTYTPEALETAVNNWYQLPPAP